MRQKNPPKNALFVAKNKKASFNYEILESFEAGLQLKGSEVKSLRLKLCSLSQAYISFAKKEAFVQGMHIAPYPHGGLNNHNPLRLRKLLLHRREINRLMGLSDKQGVTCVPLEIYFNKKQKVKLKIALVRGKHKKDKRETLKRRQAHREMAREMKKKNL